MLGRVDLEAWDSAAQQVKNFVIRPQGAISLSPGTVFVKEVKDSTKTVATLPFILSETLAYELEVGENYIRFYRDDGTGPGRIENPPGTPVEVVTTYTESELLDLQFIQIQSVMYLVHPDHAPAKLTRASETSWTLQDVVFSAPPTAELGIQPAATITLAALTGTGITVTASAGVFQDGDINRTIAAGTGRASITAFTSPTQVTVDIIDDFDQLSYTSGNWTLGGSPFGEVTPSDTGPVGAIITIDSTGEAETVTNLIQPTASCPSTDWTASGAGTNEYYLLNTATVYTASKPDRVKELGAIMVEGSLGSLGIGQWDWGDNDALGYSTIYVRLTDETDPDAKCGDEDYLQRAVVAAAADLWRAADVGKFMSLSNGFVKITSFVSSVQIKAEVLKSLTDTDPTFLWTLEDEVWTAALGYPAAIALHQGRAFYGGTDTFPNFIWGSVTNALESFTPGADDDDALRFQLSARVTNPIKWLETRNQLIVGTGGKEWLVESDGPVLTPSDTSAKSQTDNGSEGIQPAIIDGSVLFVQRKGEKLRELTFDFISDGYRAPDRTLLAENVTKGGIVDIAYQQEPLSTLWCVRDDGVLLGFTYLRDESIIAWFTRETDGEFESVSVVPHPTENYDQIWVSVKRTINGVTKRYIEVFKPLFDSTDASTAWHVDSGATYSGAATSTISGLDHLENKSVWVLSEGAVISEGVTVSGGSITIPVEVTSALIGLFTNAVAQKMPTRTQGEALGQAQKKRINKVGVLFHQSLYGRVGAAGATVAETEKILGRSTTMAMGSVADLETGYVIANLPTDTEIEQALLVLQDKPLPLNVLALVPETATSGGSL